MEVSVDADTSEFDNSLEEIQKRYDEIVNKRMCSEPYIVGNVEEYPDRTPVLFDYERLAQQQEDFIVSWTGTFDEVTGEAKECHNFSVVN